MFAIFYYLCIINEEDRMDKDLKRDTYLANWAQLAEDKVSFIVPADKYDICNDERLLIPIIKTHKIGFINKQAVLLVEPKYDITYGSVLKEADFVKVGTRYSYGYPRANGEVQTYDRYKWGLLDSRGNIVLECLFANIAVSDDKELFTLKSYDSGYCVVDRNGNKIVQYGEYNIIDGYTRGYARVKKGKKWGIIDADGNVILPIEYDEIWYFYNKPKLNSTRVKKNGHNGLRFNFATGKLNEAKFDHPRHYNTKDNSCSHYGEFAGSYAQDVAGYSDDVLNDAFDGEPDAYWNID